MFSKEKATKPRNCQQSIKQSRYAEKYYQHLKAKMNQESESYPPLQRRVTFSPTFSSCQHYPLDIYPLITTNGLADH